MTQAASPQIRVGHFESDGAETNIDLGFVPSYVYIVNFNATADEVYKDETWLKEMGDAISIWHYIIFNDSGSDVTTPVMKSSGGYISAYDTSSVAEASSTVSDSGFKGFTIAAGFMDDSDEIWYYAVGSDRDVDHGDINA